MKIYLIRHGQTPGNAQGRYVGCTDEGLSEKGIAQAKTLAGTLPEISKVYAGPMRRCQETAALIFPNQEIHIFPGIRECDFGRFEYKNFEELNGDADYQCWIDSGGMLPFPGGESREEYTEAMAGIFENEIRQIAISDISGSEGSQRKEISKSEAAIALVCHGGTIMALLDRYSKPHQDYFSWQTGCCHGYVVQLCTDSDGGIFFCGMADFRTT